MTTIAPISTNTHFLEPTLVAVYPNAFRETEELEPSQLLAWVEDARTMCAADGQRFRASSQRVADIFDVMRMQDKRAEEFHERERGRFEVAITERTTAFSQRNDAQSELDAWWVEAKKEFDEEQIQKLLEERIAAPRRGKAILYGKYRDMFGPELKKHISVLHTTRDAGLTKRDDCKKFWEGFKF
ncbi:hypothetical protein B0H10DRAFT_1937976 [Mycena sp. CBHHK59/15]|nr:hypothetical protein B0H10DRAFT_1937976 [Mycena sp. CBHHK59/15]